MPFPGVSRAWTSRSARFVPLLLAAAFLPAPGHAGPCTAGIDELQAAVDARIDTTAGIGRMARESPAATEHHEPTPGSIAQAEESLREGSGYEQVLATLGLAREADQAGDADACARALAAARRAMGQ